MKWFIVMSIILLCFVSCNKNVKQPIQFDECIIDYLSTEDDNFPSGLSRYPFFCQGDDDKILFLYAKDLLYIYIYIYKRGSFNLDYKLFLTKVLNQQLTLNNEDGYIFYLDKDVTSQYQTRKISDFFLLYFKQDTNRRYILNNNIPENQRNTIFYYLFINNYLTMFDDYAGFYYAFPTSKLTEKLCPNR